MPVSEQENAGLSALLAPCAKPAGPPAAPFRFAPPRALIDWRALHALDLGAVVRDTDVDALESVLDVVAFGDIEAEDHRTLTPANFMQLFRTAQLTVNYLLHVQDRLAADGCTAKSLLERAQKREQLLDLKVKELREELAGSRKEGRHLKRSLRTFEALALARQASPPAQQQQPEVRVVERVIEVPVPDTAATQKLEGQVAQLERELRDLQGENKRLAAAEAAGQAAAAQEVEVARRDERAAGEERLQAALEAERQKHRDSKPKLSVMVSAPDDSPDLRSRLAAAQRREREAERRAEAAEAEAARVAAAAKRAAAAPAAETKQLRAQLEAVSAEADMLRSQLAARDRERERSSPRSARSGGRGAGGLAAELEDVDEAALRTLEAQVEALRTELSAAESDRSRLALRCRKLERQLQEALSLAGEGSSGRGPAEGGAGQKAGAEEKGELWQQVQLLREEKAALKEECRRLRQQAAQDGADIDQLTGRLQQPASPARSARGKPPGSSTPPAQSAGAAQEEKKEQAAAHAARGGIGSPIEEPAVEQRARPASPAHSPAGTPTRRPGGSPGSARSRQRHPSHGPSHGSPPSLLGSGSPSAAEQQQFRREMQHTLQSAERPGVVSRFPHSLGAFLALRPDLEGELESELAEELRSYGLSPSQQHLPDRRLAEALAELDRRRLEARKAMSPGDRQRYDYMRSTAAWHVQRMAELASGQRQPSPAAPQLLAQPPLGLKPIRTVSKDEELASPARRGFVERVLDSVGDPGAVYSPLARGASVLSEQGLFGASGAATPCSDASPALRPVVLDEADTPRSPWSLTRDRVFEAALALEGGRSPLGSQASASRLGLPSASAAAAPRAGGEHKAQPWLAPAGAGLSPSGAQRVAKQGSIGAGIADGAGLEPAQRVGRRPASGGQQPAARRLWKEG